MRSILSAILLLSTCRCAHAQMSRMHPPHRASARTTVADAAEDNYDIKYLKFDIALTNTTTTISGNVTTKALTTISAFSSYVFELDTLLTIDSVLMNGVSRPVATSGAGLRTVALSAPLAAGTLFTAQVFYHGTPLSGVLYDALGLNSYADPTTGAKVTFNLSESYHAYEWWPCKQSLHDKIDSMDMWITVPDSLKAGSNGLLKAITTIDASHVRYQWKEIYPIDYYLISATVANFTDHSYYMHFTGSTDSMLIQNYIYPDPGTLASSIAGIDSIAPLINYFSGIYGRYPFWQEKYGHCMAPIGGGEEHQTMTTIQGLDIDIVAHELGHQWFGDDVTCGTWADIIMNEGFANYTEYLYHDHFESHAMATSVITYSQTQVKTFDTGACYVDDTTSEDRIFDSRLTYYKGACLLHMLRSVISNDSEFFTVYRAFLQAHTGATGTIADFKNTAIATLGTTVNSINLDTFFNQWAYQQGFPQYAATWNQRDSDIYIQLNQTTADPASVAYFSLPLDLKINYTGGDTIIRVVNDLPSTLYHFTWNRTMTSMAFDPNYWLVYKSLGYTHDASLGVPQLSVAPAIAIIPNPATTTWQASSLPANSTLTLTDITGRRLWQNNNGQNNTTSIPASQLTPGIYLLHITNDTTFNTTYKLIKE